MLTHEQKTKIKVALAQRNRPEQIAAAMGIELSAVEAYLAHARPRHASITQRTDPLTIISKRRRAEMARAARGY